MSTDAPYLRSLTVERYGALCNRKLGDFVNGFNIVYGPNEAGKSTVAAFIAGVLFGWGDERPYRSATPETEGKPQGSLVFRLGSEEGVPVDCELRREGAVGLKPKDTPLLSDIDEATFRTLFLLNGDELRGLRSNTELLGRLLNMQVGTKTPPTKALTSLENAIERLCDQEAGDSLPTLVRERVRIRAQLQEATKNRRESMALWEESRALGAEAAELNVQAENVSATIATLERGRTTWVALERERAELSATLEAQRKAQAEARQAAQELTDEIGSDLASLKERDERKLRSRIAELEEESLQLKAAEEMAQRQLAQSQAALTLAAKDADADAIASQDASAALPHAAKRRSTPRSAAVGACAGICALLTVIGVPLFLYGRSLGSLSISILGLGLVVFAVLMAAATLALAFRPNPPEAPTREDEHAGRLRDAQWIVRQDEERLATIRGEREALQRRIGDELGAMGLAEGDGSLREARQRLDDARTIRSELAQENQREQAAGARIAELERDAEELESRRHALEAELVTHDDISTATFDEELEHRRQQQRALAVSLDHLGDRQARINEALAGAERDRSFDELKLTHQLLRTRIADASEKLSRLLLAKGQLESAISAWSRRNRPGVYVQASRYLEAMTDGSWREVTLRADGGLLVRDGAGDECEPAALSLGALQQLYLAMRLALLHEARSVGQALPVLADDILVNFDGKRQQAAMEILGELAESRQVIFFTCHEETRDLAEHTLASAPCAFRSLTL